MHLVKHLANTLDLSTYRCIFALQNTIKYITMPYRRLPNTDSARIRAMKSALDMGNKVTPKELAFSQSLLMHVRSFLPMYEQAVMSQRNYQKAQLEKNKRYQDIVKKTRLYLSHFIQVMNMAIMRGEQKPTMRDFYGIDINDKRVPDLNTEKDLINWGKHIIEGEENRLANGASPITNPTIALVKVHYQDFMRAWQEQQYFVDIFQKAHQKVADFREDANQKIVMLWNQIEEYHQGYSTDEARRKCEQYGVKYVYRKNERIRPFINVNYGVVS